MRFGDAALNEVLGVAGDEGAARIGPVDEHKVAVAASKGANCDDPACTDPSHLHAHDSKHEKEEHSHASHDHAHAKEEDCTDPGCTDPTHDHSHKAHDHAHGRQIAHGPGCTDPTHDHSHKAHDHSHGHTHDAIGIQLVYAAGGPRPAPLWGY